MGADADLRSLCGAQQQSELALFGDEEDEAPAVPSNQNERALAEGRGKEEASGSEDEMTFQPMESRPDRSNKKKKRKSRKRKRAEIPEDDDEEKPVETVQKRRRLNVNREEDDEEEDFFGDDSDKNED